MATTKQGAKAVSRLQQGPTHALRVSFYTKPNGALGSKTRIERL